MNIPFFNYPALFAAHEAEYTETIIDVLKRGAFIMQAELHEFEEQLAAYLGVKHAIGVADGTMALIMSLKAAGIEPGDEVLVPSHTFIASAAAVHHAGGKPVLVECGRDHLIDPSRIAEAITPQTRAIMPVQLNGRVADMDAVQAISDAHGLLIIEDSCQALGAKFKGRFAGTFGSAGTFSFFPAKTLGCFGDGGAVTTNDDVIAERVRLLRDHGRAVSGQVEIWGFNSRLDNVQAAVLLLKLKRYDEDISRRREIAAIYQDKLHDIPELLLPPAPDADTNHFDVFQNYEIEADNREGLRAFLDEKGIGTILQWGGQTIHQFDALDVNHDLEVTEEMTQKFMLLPLHVNLSDEEVNYISNCVREFYSRVNS